MYYDSIADLKTAFYRNQVEFSKEITVAGIKYRYSGSSQFPFSNYIKRSHKGVMVYIVSSQGDNRENYLPLKENGELDDLILFLWAVERKSNLEPFDVRITTKARYEGKVIKEGKDIIGDKIKIDFVGFGTSLIGKVDTGAQMSCLHAENVEIKNDTVTFTSSAISPDKTFTAGLVDVQAVRTADKTENRPVIELNIRINDKAMSKMRFNLNDRSSMPEKVLIGQNILEKGGFLINPSESAESETEVDMDLLCEDINKDDNAYDHKYVAKCEELDEIHSRLGDCNVTLGEIINYAKTKA